MSEESEVATLRPPQWAEKDAGERPCSDSGTVGSEREGKCMIPEWKDGAAHRLRKALEAPGRVLDRDDVITVLDELQRLRDDPNRLDPQSIPEGWTIEVVDVGLSQTIDGRKRWVDGEGPNPRAALAAAIKWIGK